MLAASNSSANNSGNASHMQPWIEKYRPRRLDDVQAQTHTVNALRKCLAAGSNMPHLLFYGPAGTGKTSSIIAVCHELFGPDYFKIRVKELNASDDRGIAVVREKVKKFAQGATTAQPNKLQSDGKTYNVPSFKVIILDEADALLPDAQAALRRMMEDFSDVTRFCILCNYVSRIIDPIASRCAKFRFKALTDEALHGRIRSIASAERITLSDKSLVNLDKAAQGDMRLAITLLQSAMKSRGSADLSDETFVEAAGLIPEDVFNSYTATLTSEAPTAFILMQESTTNLVQQGFAATQIVRQLIAWVTSGQLKASSVTRSNIALKLGQVERRLFDCGDDFIQLMDLGSTIQQIILKERRQPVIVL